MTATAQNALVFHQSAFDYSKILEPNHRKVEAHYITDLGALFSDDCLNVLPFIQNETVDTFFADPPLT